jgi:hypothetical protein
MKVDMLPVPDLAPTTAMLDDLQRAAAAALALPYSFASRQYESAEREAWRRQVAFGVRLAAEQQRFEVDVNRRLRGWTMSIQDDFLRHDLGYGRGTWP